MARSRRLGRAREILAFLGKKVGKLYFWEEVVSTFPLALFDHFQKFTCAEEASRRNRFWNQKWSQKGDSDAITIAECIPSRRVMVYMRRGLVIWLPKCKVV